MAKIDAISKEISEELGVPEETIKKEFQDMIDLARHDHPETPYETLENKVLIKLVASYGIMRRSGGKTIHGYILGFTDVADKNSYNLKRVKELKGNEEELRKFSKDQGIEVDSDGKVYKLKKDGGRFELVPNFQRQIFGVCRTPHGDYKEFTMYMNFSEVSPDISDRELQLLNNSADVSGILKHVPVMFRGIPQEKDGVLSIKPVEETKFVPSNQKLEDLDTLLPKLYRLTPMTELGALWENNPNKKKGIEVVVEIEPYGIQDNRKFGDKIYILDNPLSLNSDELRIDFPVSFDLSKVEGFEAGVKSYIFGTYKPYADKKNNNKIVKKITAYSLYVPTKNRVRSSQQGLNTEDMKKTNW